MPDGDRAFGTTAGIPPDRLHAGWLKLLTRHLEVPKERGHAFDPTLHAEVDDPERFVGHLHSARLGRQRFCHVETTSTNLFVNRNGTVPHPHAHAIVLQRSGISTFSVGPLVHRVMPGDLLLIDDFKQLTVEHVGHVSQLVLIDPLTSQTIPRKRGRALARRSSNDPLPRLTFQCAIESCLQVQWPTARSAMEMGDTVSTLLGNAFLEDGRMPSVPSPRPTRHRIEDYMRLHVDNAGMTLQTVADAFGCSVRTLHRAFKAEGTSDSAERCLWRTRLEACARALGDPRETRHSLTELSMRFGFNSPSHFSSLFRKAYGVSPTAFRKLRSQPDR